MKYCRYFKRVREYSSTSGAFPKLLYPCCINGAWLVEVAVVADTLLALLDGGLPFEDPPSPEIPEVVLLFEASKKLTIDLTDFPLLTTASLLRGGETRGRTRLDEKLEGKPRRSILRLMMLSSELWLLLDGVTGLLVGVWSSMMDKTLSTADSTRLFLKVDAARKRKNDSEKEDEGDTW